MDHNKVVGIVGHFLNPNSHRVGHIGPTFFLRQIAKKNIKCENF